MTEHLPVDLPLPGLDASPTTLNLPDPTDPDSSHAFEELAKMAETPTLEIAPTPPVSLDRFQVLVDKAGFADLQRDRPEAIQQALTRLVISAKHMTGLDSEMLISVAKQALKALKVDGASRIVESAFDKTASAAETTGQGSALEFDEPVPWEGPVDAIELMSTVSTLVSDHLILPEGAADAIALWVAHTWAFEAFDISPILAVTSPIKRCGKTLLLDLVKGLVRRPVSSSHISSAALFRTIELHAPTILMDEADTFLPHNEDMRGVLNSGHSRNGAYVIRCAGDEHEPRKFSTWAPKVVAGIGRPPGTVEDRSVVISMRRKRLDETVKRTKRKVRDKACETLRRKITQWAQSAFPRLRDAHEPNVPATLHDRAADNWRPLLTIAEAVGGEWPDRARRAACQLNEAHEDDLGVEGMLLQDIGLFLTEHEGNNFTSDSIKNFLGCLEHRPWPEWRHGQPITPMQLASALKPFGIRPKKIRFKDNVVLQGYERQDFQEAFARYLPPSPEQPEQLEQPPVPATAAESVPTLDRERDEE